MGTARKPSFLQAAHVALGRAAALEDKFVRKAAAARGTSPGTLFRQAGKGAGDKLTFSDLDSLEFPCVLAATGTEPPTPRKLLADFGTTKLWAAWLEAWEARPAGRLGRRALLCHGLDWGDIVLHDCALDNAPVRLVVTEPVTVLFLDAVDPWLVRIGWTQLNLED